MTTELPSSSPGELSSPPEYLDSPGGGVAGNVLGPSNANSVSYPDLSAKATAATVSNGREDISSTSVSAGQTAGDEEKPARKKRARPANAEGKNEDSSKPAKVARKVRAPRKPKVESEVTPATSQAAPNGSSVSVSAGQTLGSRQHQIADLVNSTSAAPENRTIASQSSPTGAATAIPRQQTFKTDPTHLPAMSEQSVPSPRSGQRYDPIRSSTMDPGRPYSPSNASQASPTKMPNRASASPSISSLIDPSPASGAMFAQSPPNRPSPSISNALPYHSPSTTHAVPTPPTNISLLSTQPVNASPINAAVAAAGKRLDPSDAMDLDSDKLGPAGKQSSRKTSVGNSNPPSKAASPKPTRKEKAATPPLPPLPGTGAVASLFGAVPDKSGSAPTIVLNIPLNGETNRYINFAQLAEKEYGFSGLHPRLTSQRDRLARVAAAGAALENAAKGSTASGDDMSIDGSDNENDMSTAEAGDTATGPGSVAGDGKDGDAPKPRKKRRFKEDMYDKDDPFVDDSELAWEEQAAASKDGFFVYSGPLVPEGETARVERADGTIIKPPGTGRGRGRGRGGGPGSRGGVTAAARAAAATNATASATASPSTRGQPTTKKPRMRRGERAALNAAKKEERERLKAEKLAAKAEKQAAREAKREAREAKLEAAAAAASVDGTPKSIRTEVGNATDRTDATPSKPPAAPALSQPIPLAPSLLSNGTNGSPAPGPPPLAPAPAASAGGAPNGTH